MSQANVTLEALEFYREVLSCRIMDLPERSPALAEAKTTFKVLEQVWRIMLPKKEAP